MNNLVIAVRNDLTHEASAAMFQATITCFYTKHTWLFHTPPANRCLVMLFGFIKSLKTVQPERREN